MSTPIVPSDAPHAVKYHRPTETYRVLNAAGIIVDRYQHDSGDFSGRRAMYRLALEDAAVRDAAAAQAEARTWADEQAAASAMDAALDLTCYCELCGGAVMPDEAALVGEQMACGWCAGKAQGIARFVARHGHAPGEPADESATPTSVGEAVVAQWFGEWCEARALGEPQAWIDGKLQAIRTLGYYVVRPAGVGPWHLAAAVDGAWRIIATEPTPAAPSLMDAFTMSDEAADEAAYYDGRMAAARATASPAEALAVIADLDYEDRLRADAEDAELAARNFADEAADADEAYQRAYRAGWEVMQDARAEAPSLRLLWSWAGNAKALRGLMDERHAAWFARAAATVAAAAPGHRRAAWFARQERMRVTAGELGLLSREAK